MALCGFESRRLHHIYRNDIALVAQWIERSGPNAEDVGSTPIEGTNFKKEKYDTNSSL